MNTIENKSDDPSFHRLPGLRTSQAINDLYHRCETRTPLKAISLRYKKDCEQPDVLESSSSPRLRTSPARRMKRIPNRGRQAGAEVDPQRFKPSIEYRVSTLDGAVLWVPPVTAGRTNNLIFESGDLTPGTHELVVTATNDQPVWADYFLITPNPAGRNQLFLRVTFAGFAVLYWSTLKCPLKNCAADREDSESISEFLVESDIMLRFDPSSSEPAVGTSQ
ncbi:hypothetical protein R3P38DRAFT_3371572 [Favolaschia claudopus]|uniref:Uncharacterized protein n=1 Tax=Favolaschia claudopus TaxID=2862362 RepID=A0AAV9ZXK9_9AGAR